MIYPISIDKKLDRSDKLRPSVCFRLCAKATRKISSSRCVATQADRFGCDVLYLTSPYFLSVSVVDVLPNSDPHTGTMYTTDAKILGESNSDPRLRTDKRRDNWIHQPFVLCTVQRCLAGVKFDRPARPERRDRHGGQHSPKMPINPHPTAWRDDERRTHAGRLSIR